MPSKPPTVKKRPVIDHATNYARDIVDGTIPACEYVKLACQRHLNDLSDPRAWYDPVAADRFFRYCSKFLKHYKGPMAKKPIELEPWEKFVFGNIYGWKMVIDGARTDIWRFQVNYLEVPRKNGKTTIAAAGASYDCGFTEPTGAEVYITATKEDQAKLMFNDIAAYISQSDALDETFELLTGKSIIYANESSRTSFIRPLGGDSKRQDGLNPLAVYMDELHAWPNLDLWTVMKNAFGARDHWHIVAITTAGSNRESVCWQQREHLIRVLKGDIEDFRKFGVIYTVDDDQKENWQDERNWFIANPNLGTGKQLEYMRGEAKAAAQIPSLLNQFLNKQLNIWTDVAEAWLDINVWRKAARSYLWEFLKHKRCSAAFDLARVADLSALCLVYPKQNGLDKFHVWPRFYIPEFGIKERSDNDGVDYKLWASKGFVELTPGKTTDYEFIRRDINVSAKHSRVDKIMYDRHFAGELVTNLTNDNFEMEPFGMGFVSMGAPTAELERELIEGLIVHPDHPILNWNAANVSIERDAAGNIKPSKLLSYKRIDGIVALIMALADACKNIKRVSKYETEELVTISMGKS